MGKENKKQSEPKPEPKPGYKVIITILGNEYKGKGKTFEEACQNLGMTWKDIKAKGVIKVINGDRECEKNFSKPQMVRLVNNPLTQKIQARYFELSLR